MIVLHLTTGSKTISVTGKKFQTPRFRRKNFEGLTVRDITLEIIRTRFTNLPDAPGATEVYYPGELGLFVFENLMLYIKKSKAAPIRKESEREKYFSKKFQK